MQFFGAAWLEHVAGLWASAASLWGVATSAEGLRQWVEGYGMLAPLAFFLAEAAQVVFSPLPGGLLPPVGALAFGPWVALALSLGGCAVGAAIVFVLARRFGTPLVQRLVRPETIERYAGVLTARGGLWLFLAVVIPVFPGDAICAMAGLSSISLGRFMVVTTLGRIPGTVLGVFLATELSGAPGWALPLAAVGLGAVTLAAVAQRSRMEAWFLRPNV